MIPSAPSSVTKLIVIILTLLTGVLTLARLSIHNATTPLWQDEALIVFVANHNPWEITFWQSLKSMSAAMPWPFIEYWVHLKALEFYVPFAHLMRHLEFYLRLPLLMHLTITAFSGYTMVLRLTRSHAFAGLSTIFLFMLNTLTEVLGTELRFHTSGFMHSVLSWSLLTLALTSRHEPPRHQRLYLGLWAIEVMIAGWSHIYTTYSLFAQLFIFSLTCADWIPNLKLPTLSKKTKALLMIAIGGAGCVQFLFFELFMQHPSSRSTKALLPIESLQKAIVYANDILMPSVWLWGISFIFFVSVGLYKSPKSQKITLLVIAMFGLSQFVMIIFLGNLHATYNWTPYDLVSRYMMAGVASFLFSYAYFSAYATSSYWDRYIGPALIMATLIWQTIPSNYQIKKQQPQSVFKRQLAVVHNRWRTVKRLALEHNAIGKIHFIAGAQPRHDHSVQQDINHGDLSHTWQLYTGGPFSIAPISEYKTNAYGGRVGISCEESRKFPQPSTGRTYHSYIIDFCEKDAVMLRGIENGR